MLFLFGVARKPWDGVSRLALAPRDVVEEPGDAVCPGSLPEHALSPVNRVDLGRTPDDFEHHQSLRIVAVVREGGKFLRIQIERTSPVASRDCDSQLSGGGMLSA
jgi:hypothetical protein